MPNLITRTWQRLIGGKPSATSQPNAHARGWKAARVDRFTADWLATSNSINQELRSDLDRLRARGRDLAKNNDYAAKFVGMVKNNIIGPGGVRLQVRVQDGPGQPDRLANAAIETAWQTWCATATIDGRQTLRDLCNTLVGSLPSDGEFLVQQIRGTAAGNAFGYALKPIDVDRIDTTHTQQLANGGTVINGIELDAAQRPVAVHLFAGHPSDGANTNRQRTRLPLSDCIHAFHVDTPSQVRGVPWMAPGMLSLHHLGNFKLAALLAAEHGANHYGFFTTPDGQTPFGADDGTGAQVVTSQPGMYDTLPAGVSFQAHESKYPEQNFGPFVKTTLQRIASGWGVAYHSLANDLEGVSYSSIRSGTLEERDRWADEQQWFIDVFLEPVFQNWLTMALANGQITMPNGSALPMSKRDKFARHEWQPRRWEWVDPKGDMEAKVLGVKAGLMAPQDLSASMGYDFEDVLANIKAAQELAASYGVSLTAYDGTPGATPAGQPVQPAGKAKPAAQP